MSKTICQKCKTEIICGVNGEDPCWCTRSENIVPVTSETCLCPDCLNKEIRELKKERTKTK